MDFENIQRGVNERNGEIQKSNSTVFFFLESSGSRQANASEGMVQRSLGFGLLP